MAGLSILMFPFIFREPQCSWMDLPLPLLGVVGGFYAGTLSLFGLLKRVQSSSVTSLLGLKLLIIAGWSSLDGDVLGANQWGAVVGMVLASLLLKDASEGLAFRHIAWALGCCFCFACSDRSIAILVERMEPSGGLQTSAMALCLTYMCSGCVVSLFGFKWIGKSTREDWFHASGYGCAWYLHMVCLYLAIPLIGLIHSVILQSSRSIFAVIIAVIMVKCGRVQNEKPVSPSLRRRQWMSSILMVISMMMYHRG
jgi:drug/metabolite transporter (DMT)-like permease